MRPGATATVIDSEVAVINDAHAGDIRESTASIIAIVVVVVTGLTELNRVP
jgi:hypothetical protein